MRDPVLFDDWHPVAASVSVVPGQLTAASLLGCDLVVWREADGTLHTWEDRCPHRGARFTIGSMEGDGVVCRYHGWRFNATGYCDHIPAQPGNPLAGVCVKAYAVEERYGLVWVCLGTPARGVLPFVEYDDARLRKVLCGPYRVEASGPRIVENFLDMAHFGFVHRGILGDAEHTQMQDYQVDAYTEVDGTRGIVATQCFAWQPQSNKLSTGGTWVEYTYRVMRPLTAILTKLPQAQSDFREAISLHVQPLTEESSAAWIVLAMTNFESSDDELRGFQDTIFLQDKPILENQVPLRLPLAARAEVFVHCDRMSRAYRNYLREVGLSFGVVP